MLPEKATLKSSVLYSLPIVMIYQPTVLPSSGKRFSEDCRWGGEVFLSLSGKVCPFDSGPLPWITSVFDQVNLQTTVLNNGQVF